MSLNVYLALFHGWTTSRMRSLEWKYLTACYGLSAVPAIVYLFVTLDNKGGCMGLLLYVWLDKIPPQTWLNQCDRRYGAG